MRTATLKKSGANLPQGFRQHGRKNFYKPEKSVLVGDEKIKRKPFVFVMTRNRGFKASNAAPDQNKGAQSFFENLSFMRLKMLGFFGSS